MRIYSSSSHSKYKEYYKKRAWYKNKILYVFLACAVGVAGFVLWSIKNAPPPQELPQNLAEQPAKTQSSITARLVTSSGIVEKQTGDSWTMINSNETLTEGTTLRTGADSRAVLNIPEGTIVRMDSNSQLTLTTLNGADTLITQTNGTVFHRVNDQGSSIYHVRSGVTELTSLGTGFNVQVMNDTVKLTVTESRVKVKIYDAADSENIVNMATIEQGTIATIKPSSSKENMIASETVEGADLIDNAWYAYNKTEDETSGVFLGIFEKNVPLELSQPTETEFSIDTDKLTVEGTTDPDAIIYIMGTEVTNDKGKFKTELTLSNGANTVEIIVNKGKNKNKKVLTVTAKSSTSANIVLAGNVDKNNVTLAWSDSSEKPDDNVYRVVKGTKPAPLFPDSTYHSIPQGTRTDTWPNLDPGTYYFRVCLFKNQTCDAYSNEISLKVETPAGTATGTMSLQADVMFENVNLTWSKNGLDGIEGFKLVVNSSANPTYPDHSSHSLPATAQSDIWKGLNPGTYHFRVCAFQAGACVAYSNDASVTLKAATETTTDASISLSGSSSDGVVHLSWSTSSSAPKGFRAVMAPSGQTPRYPGTANLLVTGSSDRAAEWTGLTKGQTYSFVVCENVTGGCGGYSNTINIDVE